jgi:tetratricopeptide (TPR) repeat protein
MDKILTFIATAWAWINTSHGAITAVATVLLALGSFYVWLQKLKTSAANSPPEPKAPISHEQTIAQNKGMANLGKTVIKGPVTIHSGSTAPPVEDSGNSVPTDAHTQTIIALNREHQAQTDRLKARITQLEGKTEVPLETAAALITRARNQFGEMPDEPLLQKVMEGLDRLEQFEQDLQKNTERNIDEDEARLNAQIQAAIDGDNLDGARELMVNSLDTNRRATKKKQDELENEKRARAISASKLAIFEASTFAYAEAIALYTEAAENLTDLDDDKAGWLYIEAGKLWVTLGKLEQAKANYLKAKKSFESRLSNEPLSPEAKRGFSASLTFIGDVAVHQGKLPEALTNYVSSLEMNEALANADQSSASAQRDLSVSYNKLGDVQVAQGNLSAALEAFQKGLEIATALANADQSSASAQRDLSVSYNKLGDVQVAQGNLSAALEAFQKGLEIREALANADQSNFGALIDLGVSKYKLCLIISDDACRKRLATEIKERLAHGKAVGLQHPNLGPLLEFADQILNQVDE